MIEHDPSSAPLLQYAKPPRWHRRRRYRRLAFAFVFIATAGAVYHWRQPIWFRGQLLYWQDRCLTYSAPGDQVIGMYARADDMLALAKTDASYTTDMNQGEPEFVGRT
ncbi:MAG TPA: hypothetical protein VFE47_13420 [Tepidisphaeraceae bacterium]|jgi:hypothetical protein|nr:hypothetical protein [Tepidisphaeraceae bacterium]